MSNIPTKIACPLGMSCEEVKDGSIIRCAWFTKMEGHNPVTGDKIEESRCAMSWIPIMLQEASRGILNTTSAVDDFKNEMAASNRSSQTLIAASMQFPHLIG